MGHLLPKNKVFLPLLLHFSLPCQAETWPGDNLLTAALNSGPEKYTWCLVAVKKRLVVRWQRVFRCSLPSIMRSEMTILL